MHCPSRSKTNGFKAIYVLHVKQKTPRQHETPPGLPRTDRFLLACCGDGMVRVFNPNNCSLISVLTSNRDDSMECSAAEVSQSRRSRRASSILDCLKLPCTCAAFRPHVRTRRQICLPTLVFAADRVSHSYLAGVFCFLNADWLLLSGRVYHFISLYVVELKQVCRSITGELNLRTL